MSLQPFSVPDLKFQLLSFITNSVIPRIVKRSERFFSRYRKEHIHQLEFLDTNNLLKNDIDFIIKVLANNWTTCCNSSTDLSQFNRIVVRICKEDFLHLNVEDHPFEKVLSSTTPTISMIESQLLDCIFSRPSELYNYVSLNKGFSFSLICLQSSNHTVISTTR